MDKKNCIVIKNKYDLIPIILNKLPDEHYIAVVANIDTIWDIAEKLYNEHNFYYEFIDINRTEYSREYILTVCEDFMMSIERAYVERTDKYLGCEGIVFISEDVNSKYISDCRNNKYIDDFRPVIFQYDYEDDSTTDKEEDVEDLLDDEYIKICLNELIDNFGKIICMYFDNDL